MQDNFSIQFVSGLTGVGQHTLRAWERRYQTVVPERDSKGRRLYSQKELEKILMVQKLIGLGNKISELSKLTFEDIRKFYEEYFPCDTKNSDLDNDQFDYELLLKMLIVELKKFNLNGVNRELEKIKELMNLKTFGLKVIAPLMREVGRLYGEGVISVSQEHAMAALVKFHLGKFLSENNNSYKEDQSNFILATPEGELHEFGLLVTALLCRHYKKNFYSLGTNIGVESLVEVATQLNSKAVVLGIVNLPQVRPQQAVREFLSSLGNELASHNIELWLGGPIVSSDPFIPPLKNLKIFSSLEDLDDHLSNLKTFL
jgi:DNA-binding transcriptional MerR regulator